MLKGSVMRYASRCVTTGKLIILFVALVFADCIPPILRFQSGLTIHNNMASSCSGNLFTSAN